VQRTRRVRRTVPQEFAEFQGSCRGADAAAVSIDRSIDRSNERTNGRTRRISGRLPNYAAGKFAARSRVYNGRKCAARDSRALARFRRPAPFSRAPFTLQPSLLCFRKPRNPLEEDIARTVSSFYPAQLDHRRREKTPKCIAVSADLKLEEDKK